MIKEILTYINFAAFAVCFIYLIYAHHVRMNQLRKSVRKAFPNAEGFRETRGMIYFPSELDPNDPRVIQCKKEFKLINKVQGLKGVLAFVLLLFCSVLHQIIYYGRY